MSINRKRGAKFWAILLVFVMGVSVLQPIIAQAEETVEQPSSTNEDIEEDVISEEKDSEQYIPSEGEEILEETLENEYEEIENEQSESIDATTSPLNYLYVEQPYLETPSEQNVLISWGDGSKNIESAIIRYKDQSEDVIDVVGDVVDDGVLLFTREFSESESGIYEVYSLVLVENGVSTEYFMSDLEISAFFGVDQEYTGNEKTEFLELEGGAAVEGNEGQESSAIAETNVTDDIETIQDNVENAVDAAVSSLTTVNRNSLLRTASNGDFVIVLDPGHDATHAGASGNGIREEEATLAIAKACKTELEKYAGVRVYLTRETSSCPNPGTTSTNDNINRVVFANSVNADLYVSFHLNSSTTTSAKGAEVYYYAGDSTTKGIAQSVQNQLVALGLNNRGVKESSGLVALKYPQQYGFPGILIEHAFLSNTSDVNNYLNSSGYQRLGAADAKGIAQYFNLGTANHTATIVSKDNFNGKFSVKVTGVIPTGGSIDLAVWKRGTNVTSDSWTKIKTHNQGGYSIIEYDIDAYDTYYIHAYVSNATKSFAELECNMSKSTAKVSISDTSGNETKYQAKTTIENLPDNLKSISYAVWSDKAGQDDLKWHTATKNGNTYTANIKISDFKDTGTFHMHTYAYTSEGNNILLNATNFVITSPSASLKVGEQKGDGTADITIEKVNAPSGVIQLRVAVWSKKDQSDIYWYNALKQGGGSFKTSIKLENHGFAAGQYNVHAYLTDGNGMVTFIGGESVSMKKPEAQAVVNKATDEKSVSVVLNNAGLFGAVKGVQFAVWSDKNSQDDMKWYSGMKSGEQWISTVVISNHKDTGLYNVHAYVVLADNKMVLADRNTFLIEPPKANISVGEQEEDGTAEVLVSNISAPSGVKTVVVPVWSKTDQSNIYWYTATKQSNGEYKAVIDMSKHGYAAGKYTTHVYVTDGNGFQTMVGSGSISMKLPEANISIKKSLDEKNVSIALDNAGIFGAVKTIHFAVWSNKNGQDDSKWYSATKIGNKWTHTVSLNAHRDTGLYNVHTYVTLADGKMFFIDASTFMVEPPKANVSVGEQKENGTAEILISNISTPSGVKTVVIPVWSKTDQSNIYWYTATKQSNGEYKAVIDMSKHGYVAGKYTAHIYITDGNGFQTVTGAVSIEMSLPEASITISKSSDEKTVTMNISNAGVYGNVQNVSYAVWSITNGQDDCRWYSGSNSASNWNAKFQVSNHKNPGEYKVHTYVTLSNGSQFFVGEKKFTITSATAQIIASDEKEDGTIDLTINKISIPSGVSSVIVPVWSEADQSNIYWYPAVKQSDGSYKITIRRENHGGESGTYNVHAYLTDGNGFQTFLGAKTVSLSQKGDKGTISVTDYNEDTGTFNVRLSDVFISAGVSEVQVAIWSLENQSNMKWYSTSTSTNGVYTVQFRPGYHKNVSGTYNIHVYVKDKNSTMHLLGRTTQYVVAPPLTEIMGSSQATATQMAAYYNKYKPAGVTFDKFTNAKYGTEYDGCYGKSGVNNITQLAQIYIEEGQAEGVRGDVAFIQAMLETGFLAFGGDVYPDQYNFAGLGATGNGVTGEVFPDVRTGVRAQIQHLKAYASDKPLVNPCVDNRFKYVTRLSAPYIEWLGIPDNPYGGGWAAGKDYGAKILDMLSKLKKC